MKKILCVILALTMLGGVLTGCGSGSEKLMKEMQENPRTVVATIGDQEIYAYELQIFMRMGATKEEALEQMKAIKSFVQKAGEMELSVSEEEVENIKAQMSTEKENDAEYFGLMLDAYMCSEQDYIDFIILQQYQSVVGQKCEEDGLLPAPTDEEILEYYNSNFLMSEHILFSTVDENRQPIGDEAVIAEKEAKAKEVSDKIKAGEPYESFISLTEEPGRDEDGMLFLNTSMFDVNDIALSYLPQMGIATMVSEFEAGTAALEIGEISEPVKSDFGYHIIRRLALPTEGEEFEAVKQGIAMVLDNVKYTELVDSWVAEYESTVKDDYFNALTVTPYTEDEELMQRLQNWEIAQQQAQAEATQQPEEEVTQE